MRTSYQTTIFAGLSFLLGWGVCGMIPTSAISAVTNEAAATSSDVGSTGLTGDWSQWGGSSERNNVPVGKGIPSTWDVGGFDRDTGQWQQEKSKNIKWVVAVGSQTYGNPVVADGHVFVGTNNGSGYLRRYPAEVDLGCLLAFDTKDGSFLWQHSSEKLPTGRVHDWPLQGICCAPYVENDRLWYVTSRGEVACLDTQGFYDNEDDGPEKSGLARLFQDSPDLIGGLDSGQLHPALAAVLSTAGHDLGLRYRVQAETKGESWLVSVRVKREKQYYGIQLQDNMVVISDRGLGKEPGEPSPIATVPADLISGMDNGQLPGGLRSLLEVRGMKLPETVAVEASAPGKWTLTATVDDQPREILLRREGPNLSAYKKLTLADKQEADTVWMFDMMSELGVSQHNMCSCSVTALGDILFVNTSNGVDESHKNIPSVKAPSFIAMDKHTGQVLWTDDSPGPNILHGQWSSPAVGLLDGVQQVIFGGGDGWVYSFVANQGRNGAPELLWKFDANPKDSEWILGGRGTRNNIIATPVIYQGLVYVAVGQDPEHGPGGGHLWCIDPSKRGDVSPQLVVQVNDRSKIVPHRRLIAIDETAGEVAIDNVNSAAVWHYSQYDQNGDGEFEMHETMNRSCGTVAIKDDLLFIADFSGIFHCLDAKTGKVHWTYDMLSSAWGSPLIVEDRVYVGDEDGRVAVFQLSAEPHEPQSIDMLNSVYSTPIVAHNVLYISNKTHLFAIEETN